MPGYYYETMKAEPAKNDPGYAEWKETMDKINKQASIIIGKNCNGPLGDIKLRFIPENVKFENMEEENFE